MPEIPAIIATPLLFGMMIWSVAFVVFANEPPLKQFGKVALSLIMLWLVGLIFIAIIVGINAILGGG